MRWENGRIPSTAPRELMNLLITGLAIFLSMLDEEANFSCRYYFRGIEHPDGADHDIIPVTVEITNMRSSIREFHYADLILCGSDRNVYDCDPSLTKSELDAYEKYKSTHINVGDSYLLILKYKVPKGVMPVTLLYDDAFKEECKLEEITGKRIV
jgi:hypothetical protein